VHHQSGFISVTSGDDITIWDYDRAWDRLEQYVSSANLVKAVAAHHLCCVLRIITKVVSPIVHSLMDKETRTCLLAHEESASEALQALSLYGIEKYMLPIEMAGRFFFYQL
jgi:hypothetical protein